MKITKLLAVTLLPSALATALYAAVGCLWQGLPSITLFFLVMTLTLFPFEVGVILRANKWERGNYGLQIAFAEQEKLAWWKVLLYALGLFLLTGLLSAVLTPLESALTAGPAGWLRSLIPAYFDWTDYALVRQYPKGVVVFTCVFYLVMDAFVCPAIEELYFRGYLTARMERLGVGATILVTVVFSLYHWWLPFNNLFRTCAFGAAAAVAWRKKNIYISMAFHTLCNLLTTVSFMAAVLK
ncbi:CPBP family intramembrane glutamic endopeptidase [uncultured Dysosmobacter sp.]|uniref:CPBP family intramembrane glutamic endopeptidase n=1 Tax=uncultured Dysosmobacter sp. TaxID=2591384 RepID=UPI00262A6347|nr:CPBP family intramembrane glutamic endopeptidase [uncultured Dysosmobacter sp.]